MNHDESTKVSTHVTNLHPMQLNSKTDDHGTTYLRDRANPFHPTGGADIWNRSELILKDYELRKKAGVSKIDEGLMRSYSVNPDKIKY